MAPRGHRQVPHGGLAAPTEHPNSPLTGEPLGQNRKVLGMETKRALDWTRGGDEASPTPLRLQGCPTTQGNLPRLLLGRTRLQHQASLKSVSVRLQVARSAAFSTSSVSAVAIRTACPPRLDTIYTWRAVPYPGTDLSRQWRPVAQTW